MIRKYHRLPTTIEAVQWTGDNYDEIRDWSWDGKTNLVALLDDEPGTLMVYISIEDQWVKVRKSWFIARGVMGEFYPIEREVFERSWEEAPEETPRSA